MTTHNDNNSTVQPFIRKILTSEFQRPKTSESAVIDLLQRLSEHDCYDSLSDIYDSYRAISSLASQAKDDGENVALALKPVNDLFEIVLALHKP